MNLQSSREYKAAKTLEDALNDFEWSPTAFANSMPYLHRTLQQTLVKTIVAVVKKIGDENYQTDGRNQAAHDLCRNIVESGVLDDAYLPMI